MNPRRDRKEVGVIEEQRKAERHHRVEAIKKLGRDANGRGLRLPGLWACRMAAGLTQRQLAMLVGTSQGTITSLETQERGAYPRTVKRLCVALDVAPSDLLSAEPAEEP